jgi:magnesium transporter
LPTVPQAQNSATPRHDTHVETLRKFVRRGTRGSVSKLLGKVRPEDVAIMLRGLTPSERLEVFEVLIEDYAEAAGDVLIEADAPLRLALLEQLAPARIATVVDTLAGDDAAALVEDIPEKARPAVLALVDLEQQSVVQAQLTYQDDTAGRIMSRELFALPQRTLVSDAVATIQESQEVEMIFYLYVVDSGGRLTGVASLRQLLLARPSATLADIMAGDVISVRTDTDQEEVAQLASRYDLLAIPVLDDDGRLVGIVTYDDIVDVMKEEATEDFLKMAGTSDDELLYPERPVKVAGIRLPWLLINLVGLVVTGLLLERFQVRFSEALFLLTFVPVIMGMGGNSGTQTLTLAVRGLATGRLTPEFGQMGRFLWQQVKIGAYLGVVLGLVVAAVAWVLEANPWYALVVGVSLFGAIVIASLNGALIPIVFQRFGIDPAVASGPMVTTTNDITGILIYFGLAWMLIRYLIG